MKVVNKNNPFSLMFGKEPSQIVLRVSQLNEIVDTFNAENPSYQICMLTGIRGVGKTVMLTAVAEELKKDSKWVVINLNPEKDLLQSLAAKLTSVTEFSEWFRQAKINLSFWGLGFEVADSVPINDIETAISRMLKTLHKKHKKVLIAIDEVTSNEHIKVFASSFQIFVRENLPVYLLMTGLSENINALQNEKSLTFLFRAPKMKLGPLDMGAVISKYEKILNISRDEAKEMAHLIKGYPFAFQVLGYLCYRNNASYRDVIPEFDQYMAEYVYAKIWSSLSSKEKEILNAVAKCPDGSISQICSYLNFENNQLNPYRKRLIDKDILNGNTYGHLTFTLPRFEQFVEDNFDN